MLLANQVSALLSIHSQQLMILILTGAAELGLSTPSQLISDSIKRSSVAHLFHFYTSLIEIASIPRTTPTAWISKASSSLSAADRQRQLQDKHDSNGSDYAELDARKLARDCLKEIGKEMGVPH
jgi:hypothetical protein